MPRFVRNRLGLFEFADQRVLFGARFQRRQRRRMQAMGEQRKIAFGRDGEQGERVIVEGAAQREIERDRRGHRRGCRQRRDRQARRQHARHRDHQQHQEHHHRVGGDVEARRVQQDRGPAQAVEQVEQHKPRPPFARGGERGLVAEESLAVADDGGMDAEHAEGPGHRRHHLRPQAEQDAGRNHQQHDDIGCRHAGLGILPEQFGVEGRARPAGRR